MMSSGWGSLEAKKVKGTDDTGETTQTSIDKNEALSATTSGLESLETMSLSEQEQMSKATESIVTGKESDNDTGIYIYVD